MTDRFEKWIQGMEDEEYADRLESEPDNGGFTDEQQRIALNIREPPSDTELRDVEREQEFIPQEPKPEQPLPKSPTTGNIIYDNREIQRTTQPPSIRRDILRLVTDSIPKMKQEIVIPTTTTPTPTPRPTLRQRIAGGARRFFSILRIGQRRRVI